MKRKEKEQGCKKGKLTAGILAIWHAGKPILLLLALGGCYLLFFQTFGFGIPCLFHRMTGYQCPGCGMTHAIAEIGKGNYQRAMQYNALSLTVFPAVCLYLLYRFIWAEKKKRKEFFVWEYILLAILLMITLAYGYIRNQT